MSRPSIEKCLNLGVPDLNGYSKITIHGFTLVIDVTVRKSTLISLQEFIDMAKVRGFTFTEQEIEEFVNGV